MAAIRIVLISIFLAAVLLFASQNESVQMSWDNYWNPVVETPLPATGQITQAEAQRNLQNTVTWNDAGKFWQNTTHGYGANGLFLKETAGDIPGADEPKNEPKVDLTSTEGPTHPSQIASTLQKAGDNEMLSFEHPGYRLAEDAEGYPLQSEVEAIAKWADWSEDNSDAQGGAFLGEAKSRHWTLYQSVSVDDDSYYIIALDEDFNKVRISFPNGNLKSGWDFPSENDPVPAIKGSEPIVKDTANQKGTSGDTNQQGETDTGSKNPPAYTPSGWG